MIFKQPIIFLCLFTVFLTTHAAEKKTCLIFYGESGDEYAVDLDKYNRIYFDESGMRLANSDDSHPDMLLLYDLYNRIKIDEHDITVGVKEAHDVDNLLIYNSTEQSLFIPGLGEEEFKIGVFDANGTLTLTGTLTRTDFMCVEKLPKGIYVAVAICGKYEKSLKFVKQ